MYVSRFVLFKNQIGEMPVIKLFEFRLLALRNFGPRWLELSTIQISTVEQQNLAHLCGRVKLTARAPCHSSGTNSINPGQILFENGTKFTYNVEIKN